MSQLNTGPTVVRTRASVITLFGVLLVALALLVSLTGCGTSITPTPTSPSGANVPSTPIEMCWQVVPSPNQGIHPNSLNAVAVVSANDVWAVGSLGNLLHPDTHQALVEHWNGSSWSIVPSPGAAGDVLLGVAAVSANDVWAVGYYERNDATTQTLIEHWNGTAWSVVPSPNPGTRSNYLWAVAAVSANDVWAVGFYYNEGASQTLAEHWNGTAWSVVASPNQVTSDNSLYEVEVVSANDVWAVGYSGDYSNPNSLRTLAEHWNGTEWSVVASPNQGTSNNLLYGVAAVAADDVWAVGSYNIVTTTQTLVEHWNGTAWSVVPSPNLGTGSNNLHGVAAVSANDAWAVGITGHGTLVEHWNGSTWTVVSSPSPNQGNGGTSLSRVAALSATDVWAVGATDYNARKDTGQTLVERYMPCDSIPLTQTTKATPTGTPPTDNGPNATLSNDALIGKALANMKPLKSYWVEFEGLRPAGAANPVTRMTMSGYELPGNGLKLTITGQRTGDLDSALKSWNMLDAIAGPEPYAIDIILSGNQAYMSGDGGKTWHQPSGESGMVMAFNCSWNPDAWDWEYGGTGKSGPQCGAYVDLFKGSFSDAQPRTEVIDGVPVRHLTTNMMVIPKDYVETYPGPVELGPQIGLHDTKAATLDVWVSTGATPTIVRTRYNMTVPPNASYYHDEPTPTTDVTYSLTWTWSRFNETFGDITPPPTETIK